MAAREVQVSARCLAYNEVNAFRLMRRLKSCVVLPSLTKAVLVPTYQSFNTHESSMRIISDEVPLRERVSHKSPVQQFELNPCRKLYLTRLRQYWTGAKHISSMITNASP
jgi:hypothetical protein